VTVPNNIPISINSGYSYKYILISNDIIRNISYNRLDVSRFKTKSINITSKYISLS
jgi:hypothetical protein